MSNVSIIFCLCYTETEKSRGISLAEYLPLESNVTQMFNTVLVFGISLFVSFKGIYENS